MYHFLLLLSTPLLSLNQNLTQRVPLYNPADDYFYLNGNKLPYRGWQTAVAVFIDGTFGVEVFNGDYMTAGYAGEPFTVVSDALEVNLPYLSPAHEKTLVTEAIDFTNFSTVTVKTNKGNMTLNVSGITGNAYLATDVRRDTNTFTAQVMLASSQYDYGHNIVSGTVASMVIPESIYRITEIIVE